MRDVVVALLACAMALPITASAQKRVTLEETLKPYYAKTKPVQTAPSRSRSPRLATGSAPTRSVRFSGNDFSEHLLALSPAERAKAFLRVLEPTGYKCGTVVKSLIQGHGRYEDDWSVGCSNGTDYSVGISSEGRTIVISCRELEASSTVPAGSSRMTPCWYHQR